MPAKRMPVGLRKVWRSLKRKGIGGQLVGVVVGVIIGLVVNTAWESARAARLEIERAVGYSWGSQRRTTDTLFLEWHLADLRFQETAVRARWAGVRRLVDSAIISKEIVLKFGIRNRGSVTAKNLRIPVVTGVPGNATLEGSSNAHFHLESDSVRWAPIDVIVLDAVPPKTRVLLTYTLTLEEPLRGTLPLIARDVAVPIASAEEIGNVRIPDTLIALGHLIAEEMRDKPGGSNMSGLTLYPFRAARYSRTPVIIAHFEYDRTYWNRLGYGRREPANAP